MKDWTGGRNSVFKTLGASNHTDTERQTDDYYSTDPIAIDVLIRDGGVKFDSNIWECACGGGHLSERLRSYGYHVKATDLVDRGYGDGQIDFLKYDKQWNGDIVTNPPYKYAKEFVERAMSIIPDGKHVFMFLKLQFLEGKARKKLFEKYPPKYIYVSSSRILCAKNAEFEQSPTGNSSAVAYAWYEFEKRISRRNSNKVDKLRSEGGEKMSDWISIKNKLPEKDGEYVVAYENGDIEVLPYSCRYQAFNVYPDCNEEEAEAYRIDAVTHWMPLPKLPGSDVT